MKHVIGKPIRHVIPVPTPKPEQSVSRNIFYHAGEIGDLIYGLYTMMKLGGGILCVGKHADIASGHPRGISEELFGFIRSLLDAQPYISAVEWTRVTPKETTHDLNTFREFWYGDKVKTALKNLGYHKPYSLAAMHAAAFGIILDESEPWITPVANPELNRFKVVVSRSERYTNDDFPWKEIVKRYGDNAGFVGLDSEYEAFCSEFGNVERAPVSSLADISSYLDSAEMFIGNQSSPNAVALGMGYGNTKWIIQEVNTNSWPRGFDCKFNRPKAIYCYAGDISKYPTL